jgi:signal peptidase I
VAEPARNLPKSQRHPAGAENSAAPGRKSVVREYAEALIIAFFLAVFIRTFFIQAYKIPSGSMEPTLLIGDHILVDKFAYGLRLPDSFFGLVIPGIPWGHYLFRTGSIHRGDVIVFVFPPDPTKDFIKRVIAVGGDTVAVKNAVVYLNGKVMPDPHAHYSLPLDQRTPLSPRDDFGPKKVPPGYVFVMGDNRDRSYDSRFWGFVPIDNVEGRAFLIYWSWNGDGSGLLHVRWDRLGMVIH